MFGSGTPGRSGQDLERRVAKRLTELNDWKNLNRQTRENMMVLTGVDIEDMNKRLREDTINHLLHSPLPFGYIDETLSPDMTIEMGYTHTLDKDWTEAAHLGERRVPDPDDLEQQQRLPHRSRDGVVQGAAHPDHHARRSS